MKIITAPATKTNMLAKSSATRWGDTCPGGYQCCGGDMGRDHKGTRRLAKRRERQNWRKGVNQGISEYFDDYTADAA